MKFKQISRVFTLVSIISAIALSGISCRDDENGGSGETVVKGTITGTVKDTQGKPLSDVTVTVKTTDIARELESSSTTGADGTFSISDIPVTAQFVTFEKNGYASVGITVPGNRFMDGSVSLSPIMEYAAGIISGRILDAQNGNVPLSGAKVSIGVGEDVTTGDDGTYRFESLVIRDYTLSVSKTGYGSYSKSLTSDMFVDGAISVGDITLGGKEILPGLTKQDLDAADVWYMDDYRGGKGNGGGVVDWSCVFMSTLKYVGNFENQNEGCTLRIINDEADQAKPADLDNFNTFTYGKKKITEDNKILTLYVRTHNTTADDPLQFGVQVVDLSAADPVAKKVGDNRSHGSDSYSEYAFDLGDYVGKEVIVAVGIYRAATGDYWHQLPVRHMSFAKEQVNNDEYLPGTEVAALPGWHLTMEVVRSIMPDEKTTFTGLPGTADGKSSLGYNVWNGTCQIAANWGFMYVSKDTEPTAGQGFVIKTRSGVAANYDTPESYFYSKFDISSANDHMILRVRNFSDDTPTTFKIAAISEDGSVSYLDPVSNTAASASKVAGGNGCWQFINNAGDGNEADYAAFEYDLSAFEGKNVVLALGIFKGITPDQGGEQKLSIYGIQFD
jgi:hypothetical protein